jgi:hypothetical protein
MARDLFLGQTLRDWSLGSDEPPVWIDTPSAVRSELLRVIGVFDTVNNEASQAVLDGKITPAEWKQWAQIYKSSHDFLTSASVHWGSNAMAARRHEDTALKWHNFIASKGGKLQGPSNPGREPTSLIFNKWTAALLVGGIAASAMLVTAIRKK